MIGTCWSLPVDTDSRVDFPLVHLLVARGADIRVHFIYLGNTSLEEAAAPLVSYAHTFDAVLDARGTITNQPGPSEDMVNPLWAFIMKDRYPD